MVLVHSLAYVSYVWIQARNGPVRRERADLSVLVGHREIHLASIFGVRSGSAKLRLPWRACADIAQLLQLPNRLRVHRH
jgi:hypothetical protein